MGTVLEIWNVSKVEDFRSENFWMFTYSRIYFSMFVYFLQKLTRRWLSGNGWRSNNQGQSQHHPEVECVWLEFQIQTGLFVESSAFRVRAAKGLRYYRFKLKTINLSKKTIYVTERISNFVIEDCFALNCNLKYCRISQEKKRTLRVKKLFVFRCRIVPRIDDKIASKIYF